MQLLAVFLLGTLVSVIEAVTFSDLAPVTNIINLGQNASFTISLSDLASDDTLSWLVADMKVANLSVGPVLQLDGQTVNESVYEVTTEGNDTTLTLISPGMTLNGSEIKLTDGTVNSNVATLIIKVVCGPPVDGATASCNDVGCEALEMTNNTEVEGKYRICNNTYYCGEDGNWNQSDPACTELICRETGKWGENCTEDCGAGCPTMTCFANGSCADASYINIASCEEGYFGEMCNQMVVTSPSSDVETGSPPTETSAKTDSGSPSVSSETQTTTGEGTQSTATAQSSTPTTTPAPPLPDCEDLLSQGCTAGDITNVTCERYTGKVETSQLNCTENGTWNIVRELKFYCKGHVTWGPKCQDACGSGCRESDNGTIRCDAATGRCVDPSTGEMKAKGDCLEGYDEDNCERPICKQDCQGGICLAPDYCGNCGRHYEHGPTCRNIRLDGFLMGSLPSLAILAFIVILLTISSKLYIRQKIKEA